MESSKKLIKEHLEKIMNRRPEEFSHVNLGKSQRGGRTWKQIANEFCMAVIRRMDKEKTTVLVYPERVIREIVGDPSNSQLKRYCLDSGIRMIRDKYTKAISIEKFNPAERELKNVKEF